MAREYSVWNAAVAALQFWKADLDTHTLSCATEQVYNAFFYSTSTHLLHQQPDEILFSHFVTTLNAASESKLALEDEGYENGSENYNIPTPLIRTTKIQHVSSVENVSFDPDPATACSTHTREPHHRPVCRCLTFSCSEEDEDDNPTDEFPSPEQIPPGCFSANIFPLAHVHHPRRGNGRGLPNSTTQGWTLDYRRHC